MTQSFFFSSRRPSRGRAGFAMAGLCAAILAGCQSTPNTPDEVDEPDVVAEANDPMANLIKGLPKASIGVVASAEEFVGRSVATLEDVTGGPALTRVEAQNEFRRYDLGSCRLYVTVMPAGGNVTSLAVGPAIVGSVMPTFAECLAARRAVGS